MSAWIWIIKGTNSAYGSQILSKFVEKKINKNKLAEISTCKSIDYVKNVNYFFIKKALKLM